MRKMGRSVGRRTGEMVLVVGLNAAAFSACEGTRDAPALASLTEQERILAQSLSPLPAVPSDSTNAYADNPAAAALGQMFFFDKSASGPLTEAASDLGGVGETGKVACATCHQAPWGNDSRASKGYSLGTARSRRDTPSLVNAAFYSFFFFDSRADSLWEASIVASQVFTDRLRIARAIYAKYRSEYEAIFAVTFGPMDPRLDPGNPKAFPASAEPKTNATDPDGPWEALPAQDRERITRVVVNWGKCLAAYQRKLVSRGAPWDRFVAGDSAAIGQQEQRGYKLFATKGYCFTCHSGPLFSDSAAHNIGVATRPGEPSDVGRFDALTSTHINEFRGDGAWSDDPAAGASKRATQSDVDSGIALESARGRFRTPQLRHIHLTAPYMHNGSLVDLASVSELYSAGGGDSGVGSLDTAFRGHVPMSPQERQDVVAFLKTLTGTAVDVALTKDTSKP
jgi:cytochrome c peroxidase